jgi:hypothetical protein
MPVLSAVLNPATASRLLALRDEQGFITPSDLLKSWVVWPQPGIGFTSASMMSKSSLAWMTVITLNNRIYATVAPAEREVQVI